MSRRQGLGGTGAHGNGRFGDVVMGGYRDMGTHPSSLEVVPGNELEGLAQEDDVERDLEHHQPRSQ